MKHSLTCVQDRVRERKGKQKREENIRYCRLPILPGLPRQCDGILEECRL